MCLNEWTDFYGFGVEIPIFEKNIAKQTMAIFNDLRYTLYTYVVIRYK